MSILRDLFRPPPRPTSTGSTGNQKSGGGAAPAQPQAAQTAPAPAPAPAPAAAQPAPVPAAKQPQGFFDLNLFDPRPTTQAKASQPAQNAAAFQPFQGLGGLGDIFGNIFGDVLGLFKKVGDEIFRALGNARTDIYAEAKHRKPTDRYNRAQHAADKTPVQVSSNDDDPFANESNIEGMHRKDFDVDAKGNPLGLHGMRASVGDESKLFRKDANGVFQPFAWNPWPPEVKPDDQGRFVFNEARFPPHLVERGPDGKIILRDGLQVWTPNQLKVGSATTFEGMNTASRASESWAGRKIDWGVDGQLKAEPHAFIDFNAFYSPSARQLFFGVVPYRLPGETQVKLFETASSWEMVAHESGHAIHHALKPNHVLNGQGFDTWGESFGDQTAMWSSLQDRDRAEALLKQIDENPNGSNKLTAIGEAFAALVGRGTGIRDALNDLKISNTTPEIHDRSRVLTGASYKIFQQVFNDQVAGGRSRLDALQIAGDVMGTFNLRATEHTPENVVSLEDVGKAWLKVDQEYFKGKYGKFISEEMQRREIFTDKSVPDWLAHESSIPKLSMADKLFPKLVHKNDDALNSLIDKNLSKLGVPAGYSLKVQSHELDDNGSQIVHVQLMQGKGKDAVPLGNHGVMVFRPDGSMMDWHGPVPPGTTSKQLDTVLKSARDAGLDKHGVPVSVQRGDDGQLAAKAEVLTGDKLNSSVKTFTVDQPAGVSSALENCQCAAHMSGALPPGAHVLTAEEMDNLRPEDFAPPTAPTGPKADANASPFEAPPPPPPAPLAPPAPPPEEKVG